jgi:F-type H+-transporting ATPase subunit gamma
MMGGKENILRDRITSVSNTRKITEAMRLVAAAKVRRAQEAVLQTRPFSETLQGIFSGLIQRLGKEPLELPLLTPREAKSVTLFAISGDRGLCGSYNTYVIKKTEQRKAELEAQGIEVKLILVGTKIGAYFKRRGVERAGEYSCPQAPTAKFATELSSKLLSEYLSGNTDRVELIYTKFVSLISSTPTVRTLLPLSATGIETEGDEIFTLTTKDGDFEVEKKEFGAAEAKTFPKDMIFEQDPIQILNGILPLYLNGLTLRAMQESVASELAARMQAMQSASDNAKSLQKDLSVEYNRMRQASVTQEILEICAGADAASA